MEGSRKEQRVSGQGDEADVIIADGEGPSFPLDHDCEREGPGYRLIYFTSHMSKLSSHPGILVIVSKLPDSTSCGIRFGPNQDELIIFWKLAPKSPVEELFVRALDSNTDAGQRAEAAAFLEFASKKLDLGRNQLTDAFSGVRRNVRELIHTIRLPAKVYGELKVAHFPDRTIFVVPFMLAAQVEIAQYE